MRTITILAVLTLVSCLEQLPLPTRTDNNISDIFVEVHNSNPQSYVLYKKLDSDGRFSRETIIDFNETREISGLNPEHTYILRASKLDFSEEDYEYEWRINPRSESVFISF